MADPTVKLVFTGNSADAERAIANLERKYASLEEKLKRTGATAKSAFQGNITGNFGKELDGLATKMVAIGASSALIAGGIQGAMAESVKWNAEIDRTMTKFREMSAKAGVQDKLSPDQVKAMLPVAELAAMKTPVMGVTEAMEASRVLSSVGMAEKDVKSGAALEALLNLRALSNAFGENAETPKDTAEGISKFLTATGAEKSAGGMERVGQKVAMLSVDSPIEFKNLQQLSQASPVLTQHGLTESEQLAAFRPLFEAQGDSVGSTGLRNFVGRLGTAGGDKKRTEALQELGLKPEDVAIAQGGVKIGEAMDRLNRGFAGMDEAKKNLLMRDLFGEEASASAAILLSSPGKTRFESGLQAADTAGAEAQQRVKLFQGSREALMRRAGIEDEADKIREGLKGATWGEFNKLMDLRFTDRLEETPSGLKRGALHYTRFVNQGMSSMAEGLGYSADQFWGSGYKNNPGTLENERQRQAMALEKLQQSVDKQNALVEEQNGLIREQNNKRPQPNQRGQREDGQ